VPTNDSENPFIQVPDNSEPYNTDLLNAYLLTLMQKHLNKTQYDVLRLSYGLDTDKMSAANIATYVGISVATANVRISQIKKEAVDTLIANTDSTQVLDFL